MRNSDEQARYGSWAVGSLKRYGNHGEKRLAHWCDLVIDRTHYCSKPARVTPAGSPELAPFAATFNAGALFARALQVRKRKR